MSVNVIDIDLEAGEEFSLFMPIDSMYSDLTYSATFIPFSEGMAETVPVTEIVLQNGEYESYADTESATAELDSCSVFVEEIAEAAEGENYTVVVVPAGTEEITPENIRYIYRKTADEEPLVFRIGANNLAEGDYSVVLIDSEGNTSVIDSFTAQYGHNYRVKYVPKTDTEPAHYEYACQCGYSYTKSVGHTVKGTASFYENGTELTISLMNGDYSVYRAVIIDSSDEAMKTVSFEFEEVMNGTYDDYKVTGITVSDDIDLTASDKPYSDITLIAGDVDGDGLVNGGDVQAIRLSTNINQMIEDAENFVADVNGDGLINGGDVQIVRVVTNINKSVNDCTFAYEE